MRQVKPATKLPPELNSMAVHVLRRLRSQPRVDSTHWGLGAFRGAPQQAKQTLVQGGYVVVKSTPSGQKQWFEITPKGAALLPIIAELDAAERAKREAEQAKRNHEERIRDAATRLLACLRSLIPETAIEGSKEGQATINAHALLRELGE